MTSHLITETLRPVETLDALIARHGSVRVILAMLSALTKRKARKSNGFHLSDHLRRDIGLHADQPRHLWERR